MKKIVPPRIRIITKYKNEIKSIPEENNSLTLLVLKKLGLTKVLSISYIFFCISSFIYNTVFYNKFNINFSNYVNVSDFVTAYLQVGMFEMINSTIFIFGVFMSIFFIAAIIYLTHKNNGEYKQVLIFFVAFIPYAFVSINNLHKQIDKKANKYLSDNDFNAVEIEFKSKDKENYCGQLLGTTSNYLILFNSNDSTTNVLNKSEALIVKKQSIIEAKSD